MLPDAEAEAVSRLPHRDLSAGSSAAACACGVSRRQPLHGGDRDPFGYGHSAPLRQACAATRVDRSKPCAAFGEMEGDRPMSKPPLIRAVKAKPPATLEVAWRAGQNSTV